MIYIIEFHFPLDSNSVNYGKNMTRPKYGDHAYQMEGLHTKSQVMSFSLAIGVLGPVTPGMLIQDASTHQVQIFCLFG